MWQATTEVEVRFAMREKLAAGCVRPRVADGAGGAQIVTRDRLSCAPFVHACYKSRTGSMRVIMIYDNIKTLPLTLVER